MKVDGLHHVTAITADVEANLDFYARLLGLRLVWQGVNADDPHMRHVAYGDERGTPGSVITFFDMPGVAPGQPAEGGSAHSGDPPGPPSEPLDRAAHASASASIRRAAPRRTAGSPPRAAITYPTRNVVSGAAVRSTL